MVNIGVFACDPGGHTGMAWAVIDPSKPTAEALLEREHYGSATVVGSERQQIREITAIWQSFFRLCVHDLKMPPERIWFAMEDFILKPGEHSGGKEGIFPAMLIWGVEGYRMGQADEWAVTHEGGKLVLPTMVLQPAGMASTYATGARLKSWGLWVVGREHERSANKHLATFLRTYKRQFPS